MKAKAIDAGDGRQALMLAVTVNDDEPAGPLFADFKPYVQKWKGQSGEAAKLLLVTVICPPQRVEEIAYNFVGHCDSDGELAPLLADLDESTLMFGNAAGEEVARYELRPSGPGSAADDREEADSEVEAPTGAAASEPAQPPPYPMPDGTALRVMLGPLAVEGAPLCRVVAWFGEEGVQDMWVEGWANGQWSYSAAGVPPIEACMASGPATAAQISAENIPAEPWLQGYTPKSE